MDLTTSYQPGHTVDCSRNSPTWSGTAADTTIYPGFLLEISLSTYTNNGYTYMSANFGDSNTVEGEAIQCEIPEIHPQSTTPYDKATAFATADHINVIQHVVGNEYWLKGSTITTVHDQTKLICAGAGLVKAALGHTATPLPMHMWLAKLSVTSATWVRANYLGIVSSFSA